MSAAPAFICTLVLLVTTCSLTIINLMNRDLLLKYPGGGDTLYFGPTPISAYKQNLLQITRYSTLHSLMYQFTAAISFAFNKPIAPILLRIAGFGG